MKAAVATEHGLALRDIPQPQPKPNEVLVKVRAAALNRADLATARGIPHGSHGGIGAPVGLEWAGEVVKAGAEVDGYKPGDRVMCSGTGGYAEYAVTDWGRVNPMPNGMSFEQAATLPVALMTLHNALITAGRLRAGESVMIQGASSGVGLMGLQIAKLAGAKLVIGSSTNDARRARLKEFGADLAVDTRDASWPDAVLSATGGKGVDLVVDMLSGPVVAQTMQATAILGRIVNVGRLAGMKAEFNFDLHALRRIDYIGVTFARGGARDYSSHAHRSVGCGDRGQAQIADRPPLPARRGRGGAGAYAREQAFREDCADHLRCNPAAAGEVRMIKTKGVLHVTIPVSDLARGRAFYTEILGLEFVAQAPKENPRFVFLKSGADYVLLGRETSRGRFSDIIHHAFMVDGDAYDATVAELKARGVDVFREEERAEGVFTGRSAYFHDPDHNALEVIHLTNRAKG